MKQRSCFSQMVLKQLEKESRHRAYTFHKTSSKWITDQNVKCRTKDNTGEILDDLENGHNF